MTRKGVYATVLYIVLVISLAILGANFAQRGDPVIGALTGAIVAQIVSAGAILFRPLQDRLERFASYNIGVSGQKCRILMVGLSRSGKTSMIKHVLSEDQPCHELSTEQFAIYEGEIRLGLQDPRQYLVSIADYQGQKLSQITINHRVNFSGLPGHRLINVVIFVVELFPELKNQQGKPLSDEALVQAYEADAERLITERVAEHKEYINQYTIEEIFSLAFNEYNLFAVRLLINKVDLLREVVSRGYLSGVNQTSLEEYAKNLYAPIAKELQTACKTNQINNFSVHLISAKTGENIQSVFSDIFETYHRRSQK